MKTQLASRFALVALLIATACNEEGPQSGSSPAAVTSTSAFGVAGSYRIDGLNTAGGKYDGTLKVTAAGDTYILDWSVGGRDYRGLGVVRGGVLGASWGAASTGGVVLYEIDGGTLKGVWAPQAGAALGTETLEGPSGLTGEYKITEAKTVKGLSYGGTVTVSRVGEGYRFSWLLSDGSQYEGIGIKRDNVLVVAWPANGAGVVAYHVDDKRLDGTWAQSNGKLGREVLTR